MKLIIGFDTKSLNQPQSLNYWSFPLRWESTSWTGLGKLQQHGLLVLGRILAAIGDH